MYDYTPNSNLSGGDANRRIFDATGTLPTNQMLNQVKNTI